jgi:aminoglycoside 6-adenylyltransferase
MRSEEEIIAQIVDIAARDDKVRAVLITGSRANTQSPKDLLQDFDVIYIVQQIETFIKDKRWIDVFGERFILQLPDEMSVGKKDDHSFHYLMLFKDHTRIDLTLFPLEKLSTEFKTEIFTNVLLDKDNLFEELRATKHIDYAVGPPTQKEFQDCCNEFWWVSTYVAKGLYRGEITYAKHMMEIPVRNMFLKIIDWHVASKTAYTVSLGIGGRYMKGYLSNALYNKILATYPDSKADNIWKSLFLMTDLFHDLATEIAASMAFQYNIDESSNAREHLTWVHTLARDKNKAGITDLAQS